MSTSIPKPPPPGKDPPDEDTATNSPSTSLNAPKSPQQAFSVPEEPSEPVRPPFTPFFTLITDPSNSSTHHPTHVHYIFSDDDPEILTSACLGALSPASPNTSALNPPIASSSSSNTSNGPNLKTTKAQKQQTSHTKEKASAKQSQREERTVILTLSETGDAIVSAHSLTPTWQILNTEITNAPTWDAADTKGTSHASGLMLRIEGTDGTIPEENNPNTIPTSSSSGGRSSETQRRGDVAGDMAGIDMQALMESFDAKMNILRKVIEAGGNTLSGDAQSEMPQQEGTE